MIPIISERAYVSAHLNSTVPIVQLPYCEEIKIFGAYRLAIG